MDINTATTKYQNAKQFLSLANSIHALNHLRGAALSFSAAANNEYCESLHGLAAKIMSVRQNEASMPELMKIVGDNAVASEIVREAYKQQRYSSDEYQKKAADQFANEVYMTCLEATK